MAAESDEIININGLTKKGLSKPTTNPPPAPSNSRSTQDSEINANGGGGSSSDGPPPVPDIKNNLKSDRPGPPHNFNTENSQNLNLSSDDENRRDADGLGPLPPKWERSYTESGEIYFIDHNTGTSHWLDPRLSKFQKKSLEDCMDDELPYGWEKIHDPQYGTYFIDHVNRKTQYENPVLEAKRRAERCRPGLPPLIKPFTFTRDPHKLCGERLATTLVKSSRGLGFTIVGGDDNVDEFLQIKSIVANGPAWQDGQLETGDILVFVNDTCVLGFTHHEMVNVFQSIMPGETVTLEVCRGYPLPFDPNDPNTEVVTTIAVDGLSHDPDKTRILMDFNMDGNYNFLDISDTRPTNGGGGSSLKSPLAKLQAESVQSDVSSEIYSNEPIKMCDQPEILSICIVKGTMGFGFTIADSAYGQKVKKILDHQCSKNLAEGDILLTINTVDVKDMSHSEVVQVLKDCPRNQEALLKVQRGHYGYNPLSLSAAKSVGSKLRKSFDSIKGVGASGSGLFRSKTPTADIYSTQTKEVLPTRPKTPVVDTRSRAKTPTQQQQQQQQQLQQQQQHQLQQQNQDPSGGGSGGGGGGFSDSNLVQDGLDKTKLNASDAKSNASFHDHDSITNDIPCMDPFPKMVSKLTERFAEAGFNREQQHHQIHNSNYDQPSVADFYNANIDFNGHGHGQMSQAGVSGGHQMALVAPIPTYHQEACYCYDCQDYGRHQKEYNQHTALAYFYSTQGGPRGHSELMPMAPINVDNSRWQPQAQWKRSPPSPIGLKNGGQDEYSLSEVSLERQSLGFGFRIVGGTEEGSQVTVGHIVPGGSADHDPRILTGDEILSIDGVNVLNASHHRVVQLMGEAALRGQVTMILRRRIDPTQMQQQQQQQHLHHHQQQQQQQQQQQHTIPYPYDVIVSRNENEGFGFVIISSSSQYYGSTIGKLISGSPAHRCGDIKVGDRIVAVNHVEIIGMSHGDIVNLIKESGLHVRLTIGNPKDQQNVMPSQQQSSANMQPQAIVVSPLHSTNPYVNGNNIMKSDTFYEQYPILSYPHL